MEIAELKARLAKEVLPVIDDEVLKAKDESHDDVPF